MSGYTGKIVDEGTRDFERYRADQRQARADALLAASTLASGGPQPGTRLIEQYAHYILTGEWLN